MSDINAGIAGRSGRVKRVPVSGRNALVASPRPGYVRRWVNDVPGRIKMFEEGGWLPVENKENVETAGKAKLIETPLGSTVTQHVGGGITAVLMEIKEEYYKEDQAAKAEKIKANERDIITSRTEGQYGNIEVKR